MIELRAVHLRRTGAAGERTLLDGVDLEVAAGEVVIVTGASGAGKSSLLAMLYGAELVDGGRVKMFGHDLRRLRRSSIALLRRRIGILPQDLRLLDERTAAANVALALEVRGARARDARLAATETLARVGLAEVVDAPVRELSRGEAQRVALARAIVGDPALLLLDEPTAHQDDAGRELVVDVLRDFPAIVATGDAALIDSARIHGWRQLELAGGLLQPVADGMPDGVAITSDDVADHSGAVAGEIWDSAYDDIEIDVSEPEGEANVVPFPTRSVL
jgi:ABC-type ATPase involved in cell division